jgi:hypothetical protein
MSRWDGLSETRVQIHSRVETPDDGGSRSGSAPERERWAPVQPKPERARDEVAQPDRAGRDWRQEVEGPDRTYHLRNSEWSTLRDVGAFRVLAEQDLMRDAQAPDVHRNDVRHLVEEGLIDRKTAIVNHQPTHLLVLTQEGKALLDDARDAGGSDRQQYHSGLVKPRELAHDVQIYRAYQVERERIESDGGQVRRVSLDYELKRDYQAYLNRQDKPDGVSFDDEMEAFAAAHHLPVIDGHLELPDLRIEYETEDGRLEYRDVELVTEHYSRGQVSGKTRAGFTCYRTGGSGGQARTGGSPFDPRHLERMS